MRHAQLTVKILARAVLPLVCLLVGRARGDVLVWTGLGGGAGPYWDVSGNWNLLRAPVAGDEVQLLEPPAFLSNYVVQYRSATDPAVNSLLIEGYTTTFTLSQQRDTLTTNMLNIADYGAFQIGSGATLSVLNGANIGLESGPPLGGSLFKQAGGRVNVGASGGYLFLFDGGQYQMSGGTLHTSQNTELSGGSFQQTGGVVTILGGAYAGSDSYGGSGTGLFSQSGGTFSAGFVALGEHPDNLGTYLLSADARLYGTGDTIIGNNGRGFFSQSGTLSYHSAPGLNIANAADAGGTYVVADGSLDIGGTIRVGNAGNGTMLIHGGAVSAGWDTVVGIDGAGTIIQDGGVITANNGLWLGSSALGNGYYRLDAGTIDAVSDVVVGDWGTARFVQNGGTVNTTYLTVASSEGSSGTCTLTGGWFNDAGVAGGAYVGRQGSGTFINSGGTHTVNNELVLGAWSTGDGTYLLSGTGQLLVVGNTDVGRDGRGTLIQSGGVHDALYLHVGVGDTSSGSIWLSGGTLTVQNGSEIGINGTGSFLQSGGDYRTQQLSLGLGELASGTFVLQNGALNAVEVTYVGDWGHGHFTQSGGSVSTNWLSVGASETGVGAYLMQGGTLEIPTELSIGANGAGTFAQSGGNVSVGIWLNLADQATGQAHYRLDAGSLSVGDTLVVGQGGVAEFTQTAGSIEVLHNLIVGHYDTAYGTYTMNNGTLTIGEGLVVGAITSHATFTQSGGTVTAGWVQLGRDEYSGGRYTLSSGVLANPEDFGGMYIGGGGSGVFINSGGFHDVGNELVIGDGSSGAGTYMLSGAGSVQVDGTSMVGRDGDGTFVQMNGTHAARYLNVGASATGAGTYLLFDGSLDVEDNTIIAWDGEANFVQSGGRHDCRWLNLAMGESGRGTYTLGGGTLDVELSTVVGDFGSGTFIHTAGLHEAQWFTAGSAEPGNGTYALSGGTLSVERDSIIGATGNGTFIQTGGTHTAWAASLADADVATGFYAMQGGTFTVTSGYLVVGRTGSATIQHTGGHVKVNSIVVLGMDGSSKATYILDGPGARLDAGFDNSDEIIAQFGAATFDQRLGTHAIGQNLLIATDGESMGTYLMSGGTLIVDNVFVNGGGFFSYDGGRMVVSERFHNSGTAVFNADVGAHGKRLDLSSYSPRTTFSTSQHLRSLTIAGTGAKATLAAGRGKVLSLDDLAMDAEGTLDLTDNALIFDYTGETPMAMLRGWIAHARNGGAWDQSGITTSLGDARHHSLGVAAASDLFRAFPAFFAGDPVDETSVLVKYTYCGDANLDGMVDVRDLYQLASHWQSANDQWFCGDFNYDTQVNAADLGLLALNWQAGVGSPLGPSLGATLASLGLPNVSVPEPAAFGGALLFSLGCSFRRVRKRR